MFQVLHNPLFPSGEKDPFAKYQLEFASKEPPELLYHYTSYNSLLPILESGCCHATEKSYLNDTREILFAKDYIEQYLTNTCQGSYSAEFIEQAVISLKEKTPRSVGVYILSLTEQPNSLGQWRAYGENGKGYSIGFDGKVLRDRAGFDESDPRRKDLYDDGTHCYHYNLLKVEYDAHAQTKIISDFIAIAYTYWEYTQSQEHMREGYFRPYFKHRIKEILSSFKHESFRDEQEWRIVAELRDDSSCIYFKAGAYGITPYTKLDISSYEDLPVHRLPIRTVCVGPHVLHNNMHGLEMYLGRLGDKIRLDRSTLPYR